MKRKLGLMAVMLLLASCGGGGGSSVSAPAPSSTLPTLSWDNGKWGEVSWQ